VIAGLALTGLALAAGPEPFAVVLGVAQDGGHPQPGCRRGCCAPERGAHLPASLGLVDPATGGRWLVDATPALPAQLARLDAAAPPRTSGPPVDGILLTHAHMGHYTGLMYLGREVMGASNVPVWAMPRMADFLRAAGPWSLLVSLGNIAITEVTAGQPVRFGPFTATAMQVPHRDELSETVAWRIAGPSHSLLWLPDLDAWSRWDHALPEVLSTVDAAYIDATFFADGELSRDMSEIPHPRVRETLALIAGLPAAERAKVHFVHLNHTNPALDPTSAAAAEVRAGGASVAVEGERFGL
jgi:pyrroloquinoline quinone biosynthesis protein B